MINDVQKLQGNITKGNTKLVGNISQSKPKMSGELNNPVIETGNYNNLYNKPKINDIELVGNVSLQTLDIQPTMESLSNIEIEKLLGD